MDTSQLTFTRFIAAIAIVIFHMGLAIPPFDNILLHSGLKNANAFVSYFFMLSGFVMVMANSKKGPVPISPHNYYIKRFARIYPLYIVALIAMVVISYKIKQRGDFLLQALLMQSWIPGRPMKINSPGWSLSVEMFFYLIFPFLFNKFYLRNKLKNVTIAVVLFFIASQTTFYIAKYSSFYQGFPSPSHDLIYYFPLSNVAYFLAGNVLALHFKTIPPRYFGNYDWTVVSIALLIAILLSVNWLVIAYPAFLALILFLSLNNKGLITYLFNKKPLIFLGEISYGIYILQLPVFAVVYHFNKGSLVSSTAAFYISLVVLIVTSAIGYYFIEKPARKYTTLLFLK